MSVKVEASWSGWVDGPSRSVRRVLLELALREDGIVFARWTGKGRVGFRSCPWRVVELGGGPLWGVEIPKSPKWGAPAAVRLPKLVVSVAVGVEK